jgi:formylglycine-generating enzyme required for sulfatase activity
MKKLLPAVFVLAFGDLLAQKQPASPGWDLMPVTEDLWVDARETTYADWYNFMFSVGITVSDDSVAALLPDSTRLPAAFRAQVKSMLDNIHGETECEGKFYEVQLMSAKVYRKGVSQEFAPILSCVKKIDPIWEYPVTGISYRQATAYIQWRNGLLEEQILARDESSRWVCRLPTPAEWEQIGQLSYDKGVAGAPEERLHEFEKVYKKTGRNDKGCLLIGIRNDNPCEADKQYAAKFSKGGLFPATAFYPNSFSLYNVQGNVSEMSSQEGIAAGGNFTVGMDQAQFNSTHSYAGPEFWLGFRCVAEKVKVEY